DFNGDGVPDLVVRRGAAGVEDFTTPGGRRTWLLRNRGDGSFEDVTQASGLLAMRGGGSGGRPVSVVANTGARAVVFERPGDAVLGLAIAHATTSWDEGHMTNALFDFDNDGWLDI